MLSNREKKERLLKKIEELEELDTLNFKESCMERYGFYHPSFDFNVSKGKVSIKVNIVALKSIMEIMIQAGELEPLHYSIGDRNVYLGDSRLQPLDVLKLRQRLVEALKGEKLTQREVEEACLALAADNSFDRIADYFANLDPENKDTNHIKTWLIDVFGVEDTPINRVIGEKFLVTAVARALQPGCYAEGTLVFYGQQGSGKSAACMVLAPFPDTYFGDSIDIDNTQKATQTLQGKFLVELSEMSSITPKALESVKNWIIRREDTYVEKYSNIPTTAYRQFVTIATTNSACPLNDPSGNRRFWVVKVVGDVNLVKLRQIKDELWYEALKLYEKMVEEKDNTSFRDPWVMTPNEGELLSESNREFEVPSSVSDWLMQNFHSLAHDSQGWVKFSDIKAAIVKLERISDNRLANILSLELKCLTRRMADGSYYKYPQDNYSAKSEPQTFRQAFGEENEFSS